VGPFAGSTQIRRYQPIALLLLGIAILLPLSTDAGVVPRGAGVSAGASLPQNIESLESPAPPPAGAPGDDPLSPEILQLRRELQGILTSTGNRQGRWGVLAISLDRQDTLLSLNAQEMMVPASNMKLLTTAAAFHYLGPEFRYRTFLLAGGSRSGETLDGDLILYGTGDPSLSDRYFPSETAPMDTLADKVVQAGIREIRGDLVVDGTFFAGPDLHPDWDPEDLNDAFAAPVSATSLNENILRVRVEAGAWVGAQPTVHTFPPGSGIPIYNLANTVSPGSRSRIWLLRETPRDPIGIEGEIPLGGADVWRSLPVPDPLSYSGNQLKRALEVRGIRVSGRVVPIRRASASPLNSLSSPLDGTELPWPEVIGIHTSPPLRELLRVINKESHNFFAETVAKTLGRVVIGDGSFSGGERAISDFLIGEVGVSAQEIRIRDGSGLSAQNGASASVFVQLLRFMSDSPWWGDFWDTLPEAGVRRELGRMYRSPAAGNLRAKTGTINNVSALSGMVRTRTGERILFSILANGLASEYAAKRAEDQLGIRLASLTRPLPGQDLP
jgi:D-alanyl-D-alanine carboxypeptidase/D-alanyl-D-alanine-endopeptidase (penicillin-binding protein 4)